MISLVIHVFSKFDTVYNVSRVVGPGHGSVRGYIHAPCTVSPNLTVGIPYTHYIGDVQLYHFTKQI